MTLLKIIAICDSKDAKEKFVVEKIIDWDAFKAYSRQPDILFEIAAEVIHTAEEASKK